MYERAKGDVSKRPSCKVKVRMFLHSKPWLNAKTDKIYDHRATHITTWRSGPWSSIWRCLSSSISESSDGLRLADSTLSHDQLNSPSLGGQLCQPEPDNKKDISVCFVYYNFLFQSHFEEFYIFVDQINVWGSLNLNNNYLFVFV